MVQVSPFRVTLVQDLQFLLLPVDFSSAISDHQQSWGYEEGPWKGPGPPPLVAADF